MGRPPLTLGTSGRVRLYASRGNTKGWVANTLVRDLDGVTRTVTRTAATKGAAERALAQAIRDRLGRQAATIKQDTQLSVVAEAWWEGYRGGSASPNTIRLYRATLDNYILPALGALRLHELSVGVLDRHIQTIVENHGPGSARTTRAVLSNICGFAARHDAMTSNPVRDIRIIKQRKVRRSVRALSREEAIDLRVRLHRDEQAMRRDLPDLLDMMLATGLRIGETCAIEWDDIDFEEQVVRVGDAMVVREKGVGLYIRFEDSNKLKTRTLELPGWAIDMLRLRRRVIEGSLVFPSPLGKLRDPSNTSADIKDAFQRAGYEWATSHTLRRTVASLMEEHGLGARTAADQLGHSDINMTQGSYFGRKRIVRGAAQVLGGLVITEED